jgi:hypothetical protein
MTDTILVLNAGSSSLKFSVFLNGDPPLAGHAGEPAEQFVPLDGALTPWKAR